MKPAIPTGRGATPATAGRRFWRRLLWGGAALLLLLVLAAGAAGARLWLLDHDGRLWTHTPRHFWNGFVHSLAFSPDGHRLAALGRDNTLRILDAETGAILGAEQGRHADMLRDAMHAVAFSPDGTMLAVATNLERTEPGSRTRIALHDAATGAQLRLLDESDRFVDALAFDPRGGRLAATRCRTFRERPVLYEGELLLFDPQGGEPQRLAEAPGPMLSAAFFPDGTPVAAILEYSPADNGYSRSAVLVFDGPTPRRLAAEGPSPLRAVVPSPDGQHLMLLFEESTRMALMDRAGRVRELDAAAAAAERPLAAGVFSTDGRLFFHAVAPPGGVSFFAGQRHAVGVWSIADGRLVRTHLVRSPGSEKLVASVAIAPRGDLLAVALGSFWDSRVGVYRLEERR